MCVAYLHVVTINCIHNYVSSRSVINGVGYDGCYEHGLDFAIGKFLSHSSTDGTTGDVDGIWLDANNLGNAKKP